MDEAESSDEDLWLFNVGTPELPLYIPYSRGNLVAAITGQDSNANSISIQPVTDAGGCKTTASSPDCAHNVVNMKTAKLVDQLLISPNAQTQAPSTSEANIPVKEISSTHTDVGDLAKRDRNKRGHTGDSAHNSAKQRSGKPSFES